MNQSVVTIWWAVQDTPYRVTQPPASPEWKLVCPASPAQPVVLGHFRFLQATLKSFGSPGGAGASGLHHGHMEQQK